MKPFYTPPINADMFNEKQASKESYDEEKKNCILPTLNNQTNVDLKNDTLRKHKTSNRNLSNELYKEASVSSDIKRIRCKIQELPS